MSYSLREALKVVNFSMKRCCFAYNDEVGEFHPRRIIYCCGTFRGLWGDCIVKLHNKIIKMNIDLWNMIWLLATHRNVYIQELHTRFVSIAIRRQRLFVDLALIASTHFCWGCSSFLTRLSLKLTIMWCDVFWYCAALNSYNFSSLLMVVSASKLSKSARLLTSKESPFSHVLRARVSSAVFECPRGVVYMFEKI